jgi:predicted short-subunit dehydrogenase-like oxidoreductase (DUF2520 family)
MTLGIIGAGNVATHLVKGGIAAGVKIKVVYSRAHAAAQQLANLGTGIIAIDYLDFTQAPAADVYVIALPDQVLPGLVPQMRFPAGAIVVHTSGTQPMEVLKSTGLENTGVFYPLQTFSKEKGIDWIKVPICVEASNPATERKLTELGQKLSRQVVLMNGDARKQVHLAAVFACNFTNHLWGVAQELLQQANVPAQLLEPLVQETVQKAFQFPPFTVQTGPAQRGDTNTIQAHLHLLENQPRLQQLYQVLTNSILAVKDENKPFAGKLP